MTTKQLLDVHPREQRRSRETRAISAITEIRADDTTGAIHVSGYASLTDSPYEMRDAFGDYTEQIRAGAFRKTLAERDDVRLLINHAGIPLARTKSGTLRLVEDSTGLHVDADLESRSGMASDLRLAMERGDIDQMSFMFDVIRQTWSEDYTQRDIAEIKLYDVSVVTFPANPATTVGLRADDVALEQLDETDLRRLIGRASALLPAASTPRRDRARRIATALDL